MWWQIRHIMYHISISKNHLSLNFMILFVQEKKFRSKRQSEKWLLRSSRAAYAAIISDLKLLPLLKFGEMRVFIYGLLLLAMVASACSDPCQQLTNCYNCVEKMCTFFHLKSGENICTIGTNPPQVMFKITSLSRCRLIQAVGQPSPNQSPSDIGSEKHGKF